MNWILVACVLPHWVQHIVCVRGRMRTHKTATKKNKSNVDLFRSGACIWYQIAALDESAKHILFILAHLISISTLFRFFYYVYEHYIYSFSFRVSLFFLHFVYLCLCVFVFLFHVFVTVVLLACIMAFELVRALHFAYKTMMKNREHQIYRWFYMWSSLLFPAYISVWNKVLEKRTACVCILRQKL